MRVTSLATVSMGLCALACTIASTAEAQQGPNYPGTLVIHSTGVTFSSEDGGSMCDLYRADPVASCFEVNANEGQSTTASIWAVLATFPDEVNPRLAGVVFGMVYDEAETFVVEWEACGDFELFTDNWPAPNNGTAITWNEAQTDRVIPVYMFAGYHYYESDGFFELTGHGGRGGISAFADDDIPSTVDEIAGLGILGFNGNPGSVPCAIVEPATGACCLQDCSCIIVSREECANIGDYLGDETRCDPNPCSCPMGACCFDGGDCGLLTEADCGAFGGSYQGDGTVCDPNPCQVTPALERSWGEVKNTFR